MTILRQAATTPAEQELTQAVRRVYERYGKDLEAFFRHVRENSDATETQEPAKPEAGPPEHVEPETK